MYSIEFLFKDRWVKLEFNNLTQDELHSKYYQMSVQHNLNIRLVKDGHIVSISHCGKYNREALLSLSLNLKAE